MSDLVERLREDHKDYCKAGRVGERMTNHCMVRRQDVKAAVDTIEELEAFKAISVALQTRIAELEAIDTAQQARIQELEVGMAFLADAIENGDEIEFIPEKKQ